MRDEWQYSHDLSGALIRGYARRARSAAVLCIKNSAGWMRPNNPDVAATGSYAVTLVVKALLDAGADPSKLHERLLRVAKDIDNLADEVRREQKRDNPLGEDPFDWHSDGYDWSEYDEYVDKMSEQAVRRALKDEARIRKQLQDEREGKL